MHWPKLYAGGPETLAKIKRIGLCGPQLSVWIETLDRVATYPIEKWATEKDKTDLDAALVVMNSYTDKAKQAIQLISITMIAGELGKDTPLKQMLRMH